MRITFDDICCSEGEVSLNCPVCGFQNTHQGTAHVFVRGQEDEPSTAVRVDDFSFDIRAGADDHFENPSSRRQGIAIDVACEDAACSVPFQLVIYQHKGATVIGVRPSPENV